MEISRKKTETPCLPEEVIMEEILPRLPVKSLLKFRCVSKPWCSLIGTKRFIKAHLKYSTKTSSIANKCFYIDFFEEKFKQFSLASMFDTVLAHPISPFVDLGINSMFEAVSLVGCCNGLVCILIKYQRFILWNPTTKKFKNLPYFNNDEISHTFITKYGFGFDELNDDYKVFGIASVFDEADSNAFRNNVIGKVYSLRSNSWEDIEKGDVFPVGNAGMYVSGKLHWLDKNGDIVSFDLNRHEYGVVELPSYTKGDYDSFGVLGGFLSVRFLHPNEDLDIWVMKEYGVKESWDKVATIPNPFCDDPNICEIPTPFAVAPNGEVLLLDYSTMVVYNPNTGVIRHPHITGLRFHAFSIQRMGTYIESLDSVES